MNPCYYPPRRLSFNPVPKNIRQIRSSFLCFRISSSPTKRRIQNRKSTESVDFLRILIERSVDGFAMNACSFRNLNFQLSKTSQIH